MFHVKKLRHFDELFEKINRDVSREKFLFLLKIGEIKIFFISHFLFLLIF